MVGGGLFLLYHILFDRKAFSIDWNEMTRVDEKDEPDPAIIFYKVKRKANGRYRVNLYNEDGKLLFIGSRPGFSNLNELELVLYDLKGGVYISKVDLPPKANPGNDD